MTRPATNRRSYPVPQTIHPSRALRYRGQNRDQPQDPAAPMSGRDQGIQAGVAKTFAAASEEELPSVLGPFLVLVPAPGLALDLRGR